MRLWNLANLVLIFKSSTIQTKQYIFYRMFYFLDDNVSKGVCVYQRSESFLFLPFHFMQPLNPCSALASPRELNPCSWRFYSQYFSQRLPSSIYSHLCSFLFHQNRKYSFYTHCGSNFLTSVALLVCFPLWLFCGLLPCYLSSALHSVYIDLSLLRSL
jgi:hypothetical protein